MNSRVRLSWISGALLGAISLMAPNGYAAAGDSQKVLSQMDQGAAKFQSAQADFVWDSYTKVVDDHEKQSGTIYFDRTGGTTKMAAHVQQPAAKTVIYNGSKLYYYEPSIDQLTVFTAGANRSQYESFLTLGFGGSGTDLEKTWDVTDLGPETIDGIATEKLDLKGKQANVRNMFDHVTIWVDPTRAISVQQEFFYPSGDTRTAIYKSIQYNRKVPASAFEIPKAKNVVNK